MTALQSMKSALGPTQLYNTSDSSNVSKELASYAAALDYHRDRIDDTFALSFISTSAQSGIEDREKLFGYTRSGYTLDERKDMLISRFSLNSSSHTVADFEKFMFSLGTENYLLTEHPAIEYISVMVYDSFSDTIEKWLEEQIKQFLPSHCRCDVFFGGTSFNTLDARNYSFSFLDGLGRSWNQIDN